jgi:nucleotide-binding universal stress UspA family protein
MSAPTTSRQPDGGPYDARPMRPRPGPILVATDGATTSAALFTAARRLAERVGAAVEVLAVLEPEPIPAVSLGLEPLPPSADAGREAAVLASVRRRLAAAGVGEDEWPIRIAHGSVTFRIAQIARDRRASVILLEKHPHGVLDRLLGADTVLGTLRHAGTPVLSMPAGFDALPAARAVVAVDLSAASVRAAREALTLLRAPASLTLVHVTPEFIAHERPHALYEEAYSARVATFLDYLTTELHAPPGIEVRTVNLKGDSTVQQLVSFAAQIGADLIACGASGRGTFARFFVGSVASALVREAPAGCAVLVTPVPSAAEALLTEGRMAGTTGSADPADWGPMLDEVSRRNGGRRAQVEVDDPDFGAVGQEFGIAFLGATYDPNDGRVALMFGEPGGGARRHLTRSIADATSVDVLSEPGDGDLVLRVGHGHGQTLVLFDRSPQT